MRNVLTPLVLMVVALSSCNAISSIVHDDQVVARVGDEKLYLSDVRRYVPEFASPEDSASFAQSYINSWAKELLYADLASRNLSPDELDVSRELEEYRRALLKYRYEQHYINDRLDTLITEAQIQEYYDAHKSSFKLERPILKLRFADVVKDSKDREKLLRLMSSRDYADTEQADTLARSVALKYFDSSDTWLDALVVAKEFGMTYSEMMSNLKGSWIKIEPEGRSDLLAAYVVDVKTSGDAPVEYCENRIRDHILSARKHSLLSGLEQDLLKDALENNKFVVSK